MISTKVLGLPQSIGIDQRPDKKSEQGFIGAPAAAAGNLRTTVSLLAPCHSHECTQAYSLSGREGRCMSRGLVEGVA